MTAEEILKRYFGFETFRGFQNEVIDTILEGRDAMVLMPTGGGKSLCYQIPALMKEGVAVVISPLIALMKDQVDMLRDVGIAAAALNSTLSGQESAQIYSDLSEGRLKLLYIAPERLMKPSTMELLSRISISLFAVDEAHCISVWGHDFRPEYQELDCLKERFPNVPRLALTATADEQTRSEITTRLLDHPRSFIASFDRPNIRYRMYEKGKGYLDSVVQFILGEHMHESGIVYCSTRNKAEAVCSYLKKNGIDALVYHAGMDNELREANQAAFFDRPCVMVATVAFGMGIDKSGTRRQSSGVRSLLWIG